MAKIKTKQIGEVASGLALESTAISYTQTNSTDYQIAPVAAPELLVADTTLQDLAVIVDEPVVDPIVVDPVEVDPVVTDPPVVVDPPITGVVLIGTDGNDTLTGGAGDDQINGGAGRDQITGGAGNDTLSGGQSSILFGGSGHDTFNVIAGNPILNWVLDWNSAEDTLNVSAGSLVYVFGNELYYPSPINISVENANNAGTIHLRGGMIDDSLTGSAGVDILDGSWGNDLLVGNAGNDVINGDGGNDILIGGTGDDYLCGSAGDDFLTGGAGNDTFSLYITNQVDNVFGVDIITDFVSGVDKIQLGFAEYNGSNYRDRVNPLSADELVQGYGAVAMDANDHLIFDTATGALYYDSDGNGSGEAVQFAILNDVTQLSIDDFTLPDISLVTLNFNVIVSEPSVQILESPLVYVEPQPQTVYLGNDTSIPLPFTIGDECDNTINGGSGSETLLGQGGNDIVNGNAGDDHLNGGAGNDILNGGAGNDTLDGDSTNSNDIMNGDEGDDHITGGHGNDTINGGVGNDYVSGGSGNDVVNGGAGDDILAGDAILYGYQGKVLGLYSGNDTLTGGEGQDTFIITYLSELDDNGAFITITDFLSGFDYISFNTQDIDSINFEDNLVQGAGAVALDANDYIAFDTSTGALYYDTDGNGAGEAIHFATLLGVNSLSADDFITFSLN